MLYQLHAETLNTRNQLKNNPRHQDTLILTTFIPSAEQALQNVKTTSAFTQKGITGLHICTSLQIAGEFALLSLLPTFLVSYSTPTLCLTMHMRSHNNISRNGCLHVLHVQYSKVDLLYAMEAMDPIKARNAITMKTTTKV
jgi:hypothetical protein